MKTLNDMVDELLEWRRNRHESERTLKTVRYNLGQFLQWISVHQGVTDPQRLSVQHLHAYQSSLCSKVSRFGRPLKAGTINNTIKAVRSLLEFMYSQGCIHRKLVDEIVYVKEPRVLPTSVLTHDQVRSVLNGIDTTDAYGYRDRAILEILYSTGIRSRELCGLTLDDTDLGNRVLKVTGKGDKERVVPFGRTAEKWLTGYIIAVRPFWVHAKEARSLFLTRIGSPMNWQSLNRIMHRRCSVEGVNVTAHTFRRSCTTELVRNNANLYHVKELLGHESMDTLKPYTKLTINDLRKTHAKCHPRERDKT